MWLGGLETWATGFSCKTNLALVPWVWQEMETGMRAELPQCRKPGVHWKLSERPRWCLSCNRDPGQHLEQPYKGSWPLPECLEGHSGQFSPQEIKNKLYWNWVWILSRYISDQSLRKNIQVVSSVCCFTPWLAHCPCTHALCMLYLGRRTLQLLFLSLVFAIFFLFELQMLESHTLTYQHGITRRVLLVANRKIRKLLVEKQGD